MRIEWKHNGRRKLRTAAPLVDYICHWTPYPFIMLNLLFSVLSAMRRRSS